MAAIQTNLRRIQDIVILAVASVGLLIGLLVGFPPDAIAMAAAHDKVWDDIAHGKVGSSRTPVPGSPVKDSKGSQSGAKKHPAGSAKDKVAKNGAGEASGNRRRQGDYRRHQGRRGD